MSPAAATCVLGVVPHSARGARDWSTFVLDAGSVTLRKTFTWQHGLDRTTVHDMQASLRRIGERLEEDARTLNRRMEVEYAWELMYVQIPGSDDPHNAVVELQPPGGRLLVVSDDGPVQDDAEAAAALAALTDAMARM